MVIGEDAAQFAGFTPTAYTGVAGSREAMHARCAAAFTGSHFCHESEYGLATPATSVPAAGAWIDTSGTTDGLTGDPEPVYGIAGVDVGRWAGSNDHNCGGWTTGTTIGDLVAVGSSSAACTTAHPLACCSTPYKERFRGFTTATVTGARPGGRNEMHQRCGAQFPGAHLCYVAEYQRATPSTTPPASGAWLDVNAIDRNGTLTETALAGRGIARSIGGSDWNCGGWSTNTFGTSAAYGAFIKPSGLGSMPCTNTLPLACCD